MKTPRPGAGGALKVVLTLRMRRTSDWRGLAQRAARDRINLTTVKADVSQFVDGELRQRIARHAGVIPSLNSAKRTGVQGFRRAPEGSCGAGAEVDSGHIGRPSLMRGGAQCAAVMRRT